MQPFFDATSLLSDPDALRHSLRQRGYVFLRGVVPAKALNATYEAFWREAKVGGWISGDKLDDRTANRAASCVEPEAQFRAVYDKVFRAENFHALPHTPELLKVMQNLLGTSDVLVHPRTIGRMIFPVSDGSKDFSTPAHQDYWALQGSPDTVTAWLPLHDCPRQHGALMVAEGTHRNGIYPYKLALGAGGVEVADPLDSQWRSGDFQAGDVLIFYTTTVHKASQNKTNDLRFSIDCRYQRAAEPINAECLNLKAEGFDWPELYSGWTNKSLMYHWMEHELNQVPNSTKFYRRRDELAFQEGERGNPNAISTLQRLSKNHPDSATRDRAANLLATLQPEAV